MCVIFFAYKVNREYPLVVIANRDEFYDRPTKFADYWSDCPQVLAGRDNEAGGAWMGVTKAGRIAMLTNFRAPEDLRQGLESRGTLVKEYLQSELNQENFADMLKSTKDNFNGYNIIFGDNDKLYSYSNKGRELSELKAGVYGLCNHFLDTSWWKVEKGKRFLSMLMASQNNNGAGFSIAELFKILENEEKPIDELLPETGIPLIFERGLSSIFVNLSEYGTRSSTVYLVDKNKDALYMEKSFDKKKQLIDERKFRFSID